MTRNPGRGGRPFSWCSPPKAARGVEVLLAACTTSMVLMGIERKELIEGAELGGVATYLDHAPSGNVNLFT